MKAKVLLTLAAVILALAAAPAWAKKKADPVAALDVPAMSDEQVEVAARNLREQGAAGLERAREAYYGWMLRCSSEPLAAGDRADLDARWRRLIDLVAQQKDADVSNLFWYTDWEAAQAEARRTGKPVLRLFMMGRLTDNLSCANSRFFRVALYGNAEISARLRENYVLCWTSVRPVPVITVDFGDGRKLERTVTGNSIHYIVNADGQLIDVMPGLVGPRTFHSWLVDGASKHATVAPMDEPARTNRLREYHAAELNSIASSWYVLRDRVAGPPPTSPPAATTAPVDTAAPAPTAIDAAPVSASKTFVELPLVQEVVPASPDGSPTAVEAAPLAAAKRRVELPLVNSVVPVDPNAVLAAATAKSEVEAPLVGELTSPTPENVSRPQVDPVPVEPAAPTDVPPLVVEAMRLAVSKTAAERPLVRTLVAREEMPAQVAGATDAQWDRLAEFFTEASQLDDTSIGLMHRLHRDPEAPTEETCPTSTIETFERSIALDTARNTYLHRRAILEWIFDEGLPTDLVAFNERVYGELFLTPSSDPWIGLVPQDVFTGIEREGLFGN